MVLLLKYLKVSPYGFPHFSFSNPLNIFFALTLFNLTPQLSAQGLEWRKYKKDSKYGKKDQLKVRTEIARLLPANSISRNIFKELSD